MTCHVLRLESLLTSLPGRKDLSQEDLNFVLLELGRLRSERDWNSAAHALRVLRNSLGLSLVTSWEDRERIANNVLSILASLTSAENIPSSGAEDSLSTAICCSLQVLVNLFASRRSEKELTLLHSVLQSVLNCKHILLNDAPSKMCSYTSLLLSFSRDLTDDLVIDWSSVFVEDDLTRLLDEVCANDNANNILLLLETIVLKGPNLIVKHFNKLNSNDRHFLLHLIDSLSMDQISIDIVIFLAAYFTNQTRLLLGSLAYTGSSSMDTSETVEIVRLLAKFTADEKHFGLIKRDLCFIDSCIDLLRGLVEHGSANPESQLAPVSKASPSLKTESDHTDNPVYGLKRDLVCCLSNLAHRDEENQTKIGEKGLDLILKCTVIDERNPFIQQWAIFALRNLCDGHPGNTERLKKLDLRGVSNAEEFGVIADVQDGKVIIGEASRGS